MARVRKKAPWVPKIRDDRIIFNYFDLRGWSCQSALADKIRNNSAQLNICSITQSDKKGNYNNFAKRMHDLLCD